MNEDRRTYYRELTLFALQRCPGESTDVLAAAMGEMAMNEGHPARCWKAIGQHQILGVLRTLESQGLVTRIRNAKYDAGKGRERPGWQLSREAATRNYPMPFPPEDLEDEPPEPAPAPAPPATQYDDLSREQLIALLAVHDDITQLVARFTTELDGLARNARSRLAAMGVTVA